MAHLIKFAILLAFIYFAPLFPYGYDIRVFAVVIAAWLATR